ncbi:hypothetical protein FGO68_gene9225 [Halteria grandinella]|uniref:Uncharacterized protein n=1 Tax=Halteria grandinella TaxID=5974 RepID=A0A8J8P660_HALGN|nr:hypothetical protein FGO68_gene9225 [Halteria grandinella]
MTDEILDDKMRHKIYERNHKIGIMEHQRAIQNQSNLSYYGISLPSQVLHNQKNQRLSSGLDENSFNQEIISVQHQFNNLNPLGQGIANASLLMSPTPNFDNERPQSGTDSLGQRGLMNSSQLANLNQETSDIQAIQTLVVDKTISSLVYEAIGSLIIQDLHQHQTSSKLAKRIQDLIVKQLISEQVHTLQQNLNESLIDQIYQYIESLVIQSIISQSCNILEIQETMNQITQRERKSSKSLIKRKEALKMAMEKATVDRKKQREQKNARKLKGKVILKHPAMFEEFVARMNPKIGRAIFNQSQPMKKKQRPFSAQRGKSECTIEHSQVASNSTLYKEITICQVYAKDMLDYMIKMNMFKKGVMPSFQMVRYNTPTTSLNRKQRDSRIKSILQENDLNIRQNNPSNLDISAYALNHDIRGYFKNHSLTPSASSKDTGWRSKHQQAPLPEDLKTQINIVINEKNFKEQQHRSRRGHRSHTISQEREAKGNVDQKRMLLRKSNSSLINEEPTQPFELYAKYNTHEGGHNTKERQENFSSNVESNVTFQAVYPNQQMRRQIAQRANFQPSNFEKPNKKKKKRQPSQGRYLLNKTSQGSILIPSRSISQDQRQSPNGSIVFGSSNRAANHAQLVQNNLNPNDKVRQQIYQQRYKSSTLQASLKVRNQNHYVLSGERQLLHNQNEANIAQIPERRSPLSNTPAQDQRQYPQLQILQVENQLSSSQRPTTIQTDFVQIQSPMDHNHLAVVNPGSVAVKKRPLIPKLKLRSRTPISLHNNNPKQDIKDRTLHIIHPDDPPVEDSQDLKSSPNYDSEALKSKIMSQINSGNQGSTFKQNEIDMIHNLVPKLGITPRRKILDVIDSAKKRYAVGPTAQNNALESTMNSKASNGLPSASLNTYLNKQLKEGNIIHQSNLKSNARNKNQQKLRTHVNSPPPLPSELLGGMVVSDLNQKRGLSALDKANQTKHNQRRVPQLTIQTTNETINRRSKINNNTTLSPANISMPQVNRVFSPTSAAMPPSVKNFPGQIGLLNDLRIKTTTQNLFDKSQPISAIHKALQRVDFNTMAQYKFPGSPAALQASVEMASQKAKQYVPVLTTKYSRVKSPEGGGK